MKIYWSNREKKRAPLNAHFTCYPFSSHYDSPFKGPFEQIHLLPPPTLPLKVKSRHDLPSFEAWTQMVEKALSSSLEKVVLARCQVLELYDNPDPFAIAALLEKNSQGAFVFCLQDKDKAFLGASPERLFARKKRELLTEAMAATRPRGSRIEEDLRLQQELLSGEKELREILPVQEFLKQRLTPLCSKALKFSTLTIHQTHTVQHLYSQGKATLQKNISDEDILRAIHPTPALCGSPQTQAFELIRKLEPFERGLYGGVIGWTTPEESEWVVAIRSCFIEGKTVHLFSGAGIVQGSCGVNEWKELNHKLKIFDEVF